MSLAGQDKAPFYRSITVEILDKAISTGAKGAAGRETFFVEGIRRIKYCPLCGRKFRAIAKDWRYVPDTFLDKTCKLCGGVL